MPRNLALILFLIVGAVSGVLYTQTAQKNQPDSALKALSLKPENEVIRRTHKLMPEHTVEVKNLTENYQPEINERILLSAEIINSQPGEYEYQWIVPAGVEIFGGAATQGRIQVSGAHNTNVFRQEFINRSAENLKIFVSVWPVQTQHSGPKQKLNFTAQYNTQTQAEIEKEATDVSKRQDEYLIENPDLLKKFK